jgi:hypothetical protein
MTFRIGVENKFEISRRNLRVRRISLEEEETLEEHSLDFPREEMLPGNNPARSFELEETGGREVLELSMEDTETELDLPCRIDLPQGIPFNILPGDVQFLSVIPGVTGTTLKIPVGLPTWRVEIMSPLKPADEEVSEPGAVLLSGTRSGGDPNVSAGDDEPGGGG